ncbi:MAG: hypothetical protein ABSG64_05775 [Solirubrobacteraceae bacterium]|jgi:hypothetical protein
MTDAFDLLCAANPVPATYRLDNATSRRIANTIVASDPGASPLTTWLARRRYRRLVLFASAAVLIAGCTAGAIEGLNAQSSAPLSGSLPAAPGDTAAYSVSVIPPEGVGVGWQILVNAQSYAPIDRSVLSAQLRRQLANAKSALRSGPRAYMTPYEPLALARVAAATQAYEVNVEVPLLLRMLRHPISRRELPVLRNSPWSSLSLLAPGVDGGCEGGGQSMDNLDAPFVAAVMTCNPGTGGLESGTYVYITEPDVAALRLHFVWGPGDSHTMTVATRRDSSIPDGDRIAIVELYNRPHGYDVLPSISTPPGTPLTAAGTPIPVHSSAHPLQESTSSWGTAWEWRSFRSFRAYGRPVRPPYVPPTAPPAACEIETTQLPHVSYAAGEVAAYPHAYPLLTPGTPQVCADSTIVYHGAKIEAVILLDARHPGSRPGPLPGAVAVPGHPGIVASPGWNADASYDSTGFVARRIGDAWLVVDNSFGSFSDSLYILDHLAICVHLHGALCTS